MNSSERPGHVRIGAIAAFLVAVLSGSSAAQQLTTMTQPDGRLDQNIVERNAPEDLEGS
jgi:hypothetical protein